MPKTKKTKKKKKSYKEIMAEILKTNKVAPSPAKPEGLGGGVPDKVVKI